MCVRYASTLPPQTIARIFETRNAVPNVSPNWNLAPPQRSLVVRLDLKTTERHLDVLKWGLLPYWASDPAAARRPINVRAETVPTSRLFRTAFAMRRCLIPAGAFYEWRNSGLADRQPFAFARADGQPIAFAGIWEEALLSSDEVARTFAIITTKANEMMWPIHERMPVIVEPEDWPLWLGEVEGDPTALLRPAPRNVLRAWPISRRVNAPRSNSADLLEEVPIEANGAEASGAEAMSGLSLT
jgi:putative SOS response-associated peptidase YedK